MENYTAISFKYMQENQEFYSVVLPFHVINKISKVLIYGKDKLGYQREPIEKHYKSIKNDLIAGAIIPTSIILSADKEYLNKICEKWSENDNIVSLNFGEEEQFRIVDGQHRLKGLEEAAKSDSKFNDFMLNVIILATNSSNRAIEINIFRDINSKAKRIRTDLTMLATYNYQLLGKQEIAEDDIVEHTSVKVAYYLNEVLDSVWKNGIKFEIHSESSLGIIGVSAFTNSIAGMVRKYVQQNSNENSDLMEYTDRAAKEIANFVNNAWWIVHSNWKGCFTSVINLSKEVEGHILHYYDDGYYIQKTTGTNALNSILNSFIQEDNFTLQALNNFETFINNSPITVDDWKIGGVFSGLTSKSGFKKAREIIKLGKNFEK